MYRASVNTNKIQSVHIFFYKNLKTKYCTLYMYSNSLRLLSTIPILSQSLSIIQEIYHSFCQIVQHFRDSILQYN